MSNVGLSFPHIYDKLRRFVVTFSHLVFLVLKFFEIPSTPGVILSYYPLTPLLPCKGSKSNLVASCYADVALLTSSTDD